MKEDIMAFLGKKRETIDAAIKRVCPERYDQAHAEQAFGTPRFEYDLESLNRTLAEPAWDLLNRGGKRWRPALFLLITELLGADTKKLEEFAAIPELIHNGTLMIDDCEDMGEMRRGKPCTHKLFGQDVAINTGNFMYYIPLLALLKNKGTFDDRTMVRAYEAYTEEMIKLSAGQGLDIWWHKGVTEGVTEGQYLQMCAYKTGTLARLSARLAVILSGGSVDMETVLGRLAESLGVAFQIQDDVLSASPGDFAKDKGFGDDITEGKRSLIVIHALSNAPEPDRRELLDVLNRHTRDPKHITRALGILNKSGSVDYAKQLAVRLVKDAWDETEPRLPDNPSKNTLESFTRFVIERNI